MSDLNAELEEHLSSLSDGDFRALVARVRPPTDAASVRASLAAKANDMFVTPRNCNGPTEGGSFAAAAAAFEPVAPPLAPQTSAPPQGFAPNRGQGQSVLDAAPPPGALHSDSVLRPLR